MLIDQVLSAQEPFALPRFAFVALLGPGFGAGSVRREVQVVVGRVCAVVGDSRVLALLVGTLIGGPPVIARPDVLADSEAEASLARCLPPLPYYVSLRSHLDRVPPVGSRVPQIEVVAMDTHADKVFCASRDIAPNKRGRVKRLRFPQGNRVLIPKCRGMTVSL